MSALAEVTEVKVEVRRLGIARVAQFSQDLTTPYPVTGFHTDATGLQMRVEGIATVSEIEIDVVTSNG